MTLSKTNLPDVLNEITIPGQGEAKALRASVLKWHDEVIFWNNFSYAVGIWMLPRLFSKSGLYIAHPNPAMSGELALYL